MAKFAPDVTLRMNPDKGTEALTQIASMADPTRKQERRMICGGDDSGYYEALLASIHQIAADALEVKPPPTKEEIRRMVENMRQQPIIVLPDEMKVAPDSNVRQIDFDSLKVKVGGIEIESGPSAAATGKILVDGEKFPLPIQWMTLGFDCRKGGNWMVTVGFVPVPVAEETSSRHGPAAEAADDVQPDKIL